MGLRQADRQKTLGRLNDNNPNITIAGDLMHFKIGCEKCYSVWPYGENGLQSVIYIFNRIEDRQFNLLKKMSLPRGRGHLITRIN